MQINREARDKHTIQSYSDSQITIYSANYNDSLIIGRDTIITPWAIHTVDALTDEHLQPIIALQPEVVIIGHSGKAHVPMNCIQALARLRIGIECMSIGAACRTFNVLLSEQRAVVLGVIF